LAADLPEAARPRYTARLPGRPALVNDRLGMSARAVRQDRIVDEAIAAGGDLRRICDLFGVTIATAQHYTSVLSHPGLASCGNDPATAGSG
jgi:hypothetical protein